MRFFRNIFLRDPQPSIADVDHVPLESRQHSQTAPQAPLEDAEEESRRTSDSPNIDMARLKRETSEALSDDIDVTPLKRKATALDFAIRDIGAGYYQNILFVICGSGWFVDNLVLQAVSLILPSVTNDFQLDPPTVRYITESLFVGLAVGALVSSSMSDHIGRKIPFTLSLLIASVWLIASTAPVSWKVLCVFLSLGGTGVGGSLPVDGMLYMEFLSSQDSGRVVLLSEWWAFGQFVASAIAWEVIERHGWRPYVLAIGLLTFIIWLIRFALCWWILESPKYLLAQGKQREAVRNIHELARRNGKTTWLSESLLNEVGGVLSDPAQTHPGSTKFQAQMSSYTKTQMHLFKRDKRLLWSTVILWVIWAIIGAAYPLFNAFLTQYLVPIDQTRLIDIYKYQTIISAAGMPGPLVAYWSSNSFLARRRTLAMSAALTGGFVLLFVNAKLSKGELIFACLATFSQNMMYGTLYAYTPEMFPTATRGFGSGTANFLNRTFGLIVPLAAAKQEDHRVLLCTSGGLFIVAAIAALFLRIETRGRQRL